MNLKDFFAEDGKALDDSKLYSDSEMIIDMDPNLEKSKDMLSAKKIDVIQSEISIKTAKLLNSGINKNRIMKFLKEKYASYDLSSANSMLDKNIGIVGTICVDCSAIKDKNDYNNVTAKFKSFNKYAVNCTCNKKHVSMVNDSISTGSMDGFLNVKKSTKTNLKGICNKTSLPRISSFEQINDGDALETIYKLSSLGYFDKTTAKNLLVENDRIQAIRKAFDYTHVKKESAVIPEEKGFYIKKSDMELELNAIAQENIDKVSTSDTPMEISLDDSSDVVDIEISNENDCVYDDDTFGGENSTTENIEFADEFFNENDVEMSNENDAIYEDMGFGGVESSIEDFQMDIVPESDANLDRISINEESEIRL